MSGNNPPTREPVATTGGTVSRAWLRYFLSLGTGGGAGGAVPAPTAATALDFIRINAAGSGYETQTPAQVLQDIGALTLAEAEALFEPLLDKFSVQSGQYEVQASDTGKPILFLSAGPCILPGNMAQGVKVIVSAGNINGLTIAADGAGYLNGEIDGSIGIACGMSAYCEVILNTTSQNAQWSVILGVLQGAGVPTFYAPPGTIFTRNDQANTAIDRVYVSDGAMPYLPVLQLGDGAVNQYLFNETSGTIAADQGTLMQNGTYVGPFFLGGHSYVPGVSASVNFNGSTPVLPGAILPFTNPPTGPGGAFSVEVSVFEAGIIGTAGQGNILGNSDMAGENGFAIYVNNSEQFKFSVQFSGGLATVTATIPANTYDVFLLTGVYDGSNIYFYVNGILQGTAAASGSYVASTKDIAFNRAADDDHSNAIGGFYSCGALYPLALSASQVQAHYNAILNAGPSWRDVQAFSIVSSGTVAGLGNAISAGQNMSFGLAGEILTANSFLTLQSAGTIENSQMIALDVIGGGATVSTSGQVGTMNVPGLIFSGTNVDVLEVGGSLAGFLSGSTLSLSGESGFEVTNGTVTNTSALSVSNGLGLNANYSSPTVLQSAQGIGGNATFSANPTSGNLLVLFLTSTLVPSGWTQRALYNSGASQGYTNILTQTSNGSNPSIATSGATWFIYEVQGWSSITGANAGAVTNVSNVRTFVSTTTLANTSLVLWQFNDQSYPASITLPAGSSLSAMEFNVLNTGIVTSANQTGLPVLEYTCTGGNPYGAGQISILGEPGAQADIFLDVPVTINGTLAGTLENAIVITTGNTVSSATMSSGTLTIKLP